jgi:hypothetical protein
VVLILFYQVTKLLPPPSNLVNDEVLRPEKDMEFKTVEDTEQSPANDAELRTAKDAEFEPEEDAKLKPAEDLGSNSIKNVEELNLIKDIEEMKSKLDGLESKLREVSLSGICFKSMVLL